MGQCNNAYSAIQGHVLWQAFDCGLNDLPLSMVLSWFEQRQYHPDDPSPPGHQDIRLGPTLPAFLSPNVLKVLVDRYDIKPITTPEADIEVI